MDSLVQRWRNAVKSSQRKTATELQTEEHKASQAELSIRQSKVSNKSKKTKNVKQNKEKSEGEYNIRNRHETPSKARSLKTIVIDDFVERVEAILARKNDSERKGRIRAILEELWQVSQDNPPKIEQTTVEPPTTIRESRQVQDTPTKIQTKLYSDLENRYFQCQKQRQHLKSTLDSLKKKYDSIEKQLQRLYKVEKSHDASHKRQENLMRQIQNLRQNLRQAQIRDAEQQRIFRREVLAINSVIESLKNTIPSG